MQKLSIYRSLWDIISEDRGNVCMAYENLKNRDLYLNKLIAFQDTEPVKVITGIRRCGKSSLLKLMIRHLKDTGIEEERIIHMNFESYEFKDMTSDDFYKYVKSKAVPQKRMYLFFDEVQRVKAWEEAVNAFRVDLDCDIYITGSNAYLLSSEYSTYLSGRCVEIKMLPLSFSEFLYFHGFKLHESEDLLGRTKREATGKDGKEYAIKDLFDAYLRFGGMPGIAEVGLDQERAFALLDGIYSTVVVRDILDRERRRGQQRITDSVLLRKTAMFLADNIGNNVSVSSIGNTLANEGLLEERNRKSVPSAHTVQLYVDALKEAYLFKEIKRFDIKGKEYLRTLGKFYITDIGIRNCLLGNRNRDTGHALENVVYLELLCRGYDVAIGKVDDGEVDFIASDTDKKLYFQVTESMQNEAVRKRELTPLQKIKDNYRKTILTFDSAFENHYDGIQILNVIDWLLEDK